MAYLTKREADILRRFWLQTCSQVRIRHDGTVEGCKGGVWVVIENAAEASKSAAELLAIPGNRREG